MNREGDRGEADELDALLGAHLRSRLDPQLGRAADALAAAAAAAGHASVAPRRGGDTIRLTVAWIGLVAAIVAAAWFIWPAGEHEPLPIVTNSPVPPDGSSPPREIERMVMWETIDERPTLVGNQVGNQLPVRKLRQEGVEQVHYYDPHDRATIRVTVPLVRDVMVEMETY
jgi:hypothetical protein